MPHRYFGKLVMGSDLGRVCSEGNTKDAGVRERRAGGGEEREQGRGLEQEQRCLCVCVCVCVCVYVHMLTQRSTNRGTLCQLASCPLLPFVCFTKRSAMLTLVCVFVHVQMDNQICGNSGYAPPPHTHRYVRGTRIPFSAFHPLSRPGRLTAFYGCREGVLLTAYNK